MSVSTIVYSQIVKELGQCLAENPRHHMLIIKDEHLKDLVRKKKPEMTGPLWQCKYCNKIVEAS